MESFCTVLYVNIFPLQEVWGIPQTMPSFKERGMGGWDCMPRAFVAWLGIHTAVEMVFVCQVVESQESVRRFRYFGYIIMTQRKDTESDVRMSQLCLF